MKFLTNDMYNDLDLAGGQGICVVAMETTPGGLTGHHPGDWHGDTTVSIRDAA